MVAVPADTTAPTISVVVKSYNHAPYVAQSIQSVLDQSFQDFEIVITDDGSTDGTADVIRGFTDERISFERFEHNRGISIAMNSVTARARGEFIAILNSDDFALPGRLETQLAYLRAHPQLGAAFGLPRQVDENGDPVHGFERFVSPFAEPNPPRAAWLRHFFLRANCLCAPTAMIRRSAYVETGRYDPRLTNLPDLDRWIRLANRHEIAIVPTELTAFRVRARSANLSAPRPDSILRTYFEYAQILKRYRGFAPDFLRIVFAEDVERHGIDTRRPLGVWLAEIALLAGSPSHRLFALESLYDAASDDADFRRLRDLAGSVNVFGVTDAIEPT